MFDAKYRPKRFKEVVGQDAVVAQLKGMVKTGRVPKALLLGGPYGCGKTTLAHIFARAINCAKPQDGEPCLKCEPCKDAADVIEVNVADERGIDTMRQLVETTVYAPSYNYRVYILDEFHQATSHAQQALLKPLENPQGRTVWIICTTDPGAVLPTIVSRCRVMRLGKPSDKEIAKYLKRIAKKEGLNLSPKELKLIASYCDGHVRDAVKALEAVADALAAGGKLKPEDLQRVVETTIGKDDRQAAYKWLLAFLKGSYSGLFSALHEVDRYDQFFVQLGYAYENLLYSYYNPKLVAPYHKRFVEAAHRVNGSPDRAVLGRLGALLGEYLSLAKRYAMDPRLAALAFTSRALELVDGVK